LIPIYVGIGNLLLGEGMGESVEELTTELRFISQLIELHMKYSMALKSKKVWLSAINAIIEVV
jgi:hypothetical protein